MNSYDVFDSKFRRVGGSQDAQVVLLCVEPVQATGDTAHTSVLRLPY